MLQLIKAVTNTRHIGKSNDVLSLNTNFCRNIVTREKERFRKFFATMFQIKILIGNSRI